jgi:replication-associated recombination protein RarA
MNLYEYYRPKCITDLVGHTAVKKVIRTILDSGWWGGRAWWVSGPSGSGKTTLARILAHQGADDMFIQELDSGRELTTEAMNDIDDSMRYLALGRKNGRAYIVNEAHCLRLAMVQRLLGVLERLPEHVCWIFTTTVEGQLQFFEDNTDAAPLLSRCLHVELDTKNLIKPFARRAKWIAQKEHLDGRPLNEYVELAQQCKCNLRMMIQKIESGAMLKK